MGSLWILRFLDSRVFATCSDDSTVALWDARNLKSRIRTLYGHSNWVKNIEFSSREDLLVTSGFDGSIYTWDINSYTESGFLYNRVFHTNGLMRTRLNPDASKMIICTTGGYLIIIHDLDLHNLPFDLYGFKPNMYRLMQLSQATIPMAVCFNHLFSRWRRRNRVEFVTDFPVNDDAEVVSSLQVHPQGWSVLSRNISNDETSEWSCVHDIQERDPESDEEELDCPDRDVSKENSTSGEDGASQEERPVTSSSLIILSAASSSRSSSSSNQNSETTDPPPPPSNCPQVPSPSAGPSTRSSSREIAISRRGRTAGNTNQPQDNNSQNFPNSDVWEAVLAIRDARMLRENRGRNTWDARWTLSRPNAGAIELGPMGRSGRGVAPSRVVVQAHSSSAGVNGSPAEASNRRGARSNRHPLGHRTSTDAVGSNDDIIEEFQFRGFSNPGNELANLSNTKIHKNINRLTHYCEEPNVGRGFIKELCFGAGGRLVCSPFGSGVRLLAFSPDCSELCTVVPPNPPIKLHEVATNICHSDIVVSTKFSPTHCLLVSGCLKGKIVWHQPIL
ncbi:DDB1- and CUL4-associated factor 10 isoform X2 [Ischnura elegans]|uniref:DDB1- and CUL4-associated factor 10 isoform X2 n=1 Tax=Ischnura elegans TaxID=197161 RepID=UPI001ED8A8A2|nr:DDB1- and CUL4-associated factor 10 isoform X2 [Ischnura elegans]XP_046383115.1 DDB1- and CUL4-associated factor 10 isoform X2 [Ischnura elegans]XP_046383116.1 DDB1- and CUL4-associated factor 10 isoform X2 [Ischnura elegans]XP_046383117.1 DDB1- and CUL4-associated factor 10 isoform X2 [Ischnura elegans]